MFVVLAVVLVACVALAALDAERARRRHRDSPGPLPIAPLFSARAQSGVQPAARIVALIPARDEEAAIGEVIASLRAQSRPVDAIVVIDDGSADATAARARAALAGAACACVVAAGAL